MARAYVASVNGFLTQRDGTSFATATSAVQTGMREQLSAEDRRMAAMLAKCDAGQLAAALAPVLGKGGANLVFGVGVMAMAWSSIIILISMNGLAIGALFKTTRIEVCFVWAQ
ncbi:MAG: hypothetical protein J6386_06070 [Candidatus Synoicihabitans palmerolidicus]|nr:hypothetical protein [Candidatus Synoicihabitans palmerolidicus]